MPRYQCTRGKKYRRHRTVPTFCGPPLPGLVNLKIPPHLESVVEVNRDEAEVWGRRRHSVDESTMRLRFGQLKGTPLKANMVLSVAR
jgi:hypothetical protein